MIYAILDKTLGEIYFTDKKRCDDELETTELLYMSDSITLDDVKEKLRPWINLEIRERDYYRNSPEIKKYIETSKVSYSYTKIYPQDIDREINQFFEDCKFLSQLGSLKNSIYKVDIEKIRDRIEYDCDIYNYLENILGKDDVDTVCFYRLLDPCCKKFLSEFVGIGTRDKRSEYLKRSLVPQNNPEVLEFLPLWYRLDYKMSGGYKKSNESSELEYKRNKQLGNIEPNIEDKIRGEFFEVFKLGMVFSGHEIKKMIQEIYDSNGIKRTAKISDLYDYFEVTNVSSASSYRIDLRK